jgi:hypothetical protein
VVEGPHTGFKGSSSYTIQVRDDSRRHIILFENIANAYKVAGILSEDNIFFAAQRFS